MGALAHFSDRQPLEKSAPNLHERGSEPLKAREATSVRAIAYIGRFAPSPTGPLHAGSLVAALASWLDARAHGGQWLVRIEDIDTPRCVPGADQIIFQQLAACGLYSDVPPVYQSARSNFYQCALDQLIEQGQAYPCACSRQDIDEALAASGQQRLRHGELVYPGTCRGGLNGKKARSWRFSSSICILNKLLASVNRAQTAPDSGATNIDWNDRLLGLQSQNVSLDVGDFVLRRADSLWAYQLAVVVDDAAQGITHVVRGQDLAGNTARQILLQRALDLPQPQYLHTPLVLGADGEKLSKQNGAQAVNMNQAVPALQSAALTLGLRINASSVAECLNNALLAWVAVLK